MVGPIFILEQYNSNTHHRVLHKIIIIYWYLFTSLLIAIADAETNFYYVTIQLKHPPQSFA